VISSSSLCPGASGLHGNYGLSDQEAALRWVNAHISLVGGDNSRVTVGAERRGADITSLHLRSSSSPLFQRMMLMVRRFLLSILRFIIRLSAASFRCFCRPFGFRSSEKYYFFLQLISFLTQLT